MIRKSGQSTLEVAVIVACITAALIAMSVYIKRGIQGRLRQSADEISQQHYSAKNTSASILDNPNIKITLEQNKEIEVYKEGATGVEIGDKSFDGDYYKRKETVTKDETITTVKEKVE